MELTFVIIYALVTTLPLTIGTAIVRNKLYREVKKLQIEVESLSKTGELNRASRSTLLNKLENKSREASLKSLERNIEQIDIVSLLDEVWNNNKFRWEQKIDSVSPYLTFYSPLPCPNQQFSHSQSLKLVQSRTILKEEADTI